MDKLTKQPWIGKIAHYQQCLFHSVKPNGINQYLRGEGIIITKDGAKLSSNEINNYLTPIQMALYVKSIRHFN